MQTSMSGAAYLRLVGVAALVGIPAALVAAAFFTFVHEGQHWLWHDLPDALGHATPPAYLLIGLPVVGALIVLAARALLPGDGGHRPIMGLSMEPTPVAHVPGVLLAALGTLLFGAVLGPESPVVALGSAVGMLAVRAVRAEGQGMQMLSSAGSFSAISALFGGPIVAGMLFVEAGAGLGAALLPALLPGVVAAAVGYVVFIGVRDWPGLSPAGFTVPDLPPYQGTHIVDLFLGVAIGLLAAVVVAGVHAIAHRVEALQSRIGRALPLVGGGLAVGLLAWIGGLLGANPQDILFSGQASIGPIVGATSAGVVVVVLATKFVAYAVSMGCGFRGGPIFPAIFLGVALTAVAVVLFDTSPTLAVAVGTAAGMAAQARLLFAPLVFSILLVGSSGFDAVSAAALAAATAWIATTALDKRRQAAQPEAVATPTASG